MGRPSTRAGGHVALAEFGVELDVEAGVVAIERREVQVRVDDFEIRGHLDVAGGDVAGAFDIERERAGAVAERAEANFLDVEEELGGVLLHAGDGGEFVLHLVDADGGDGGAFERAEEHAAQGVAERDAVAGFERLGDEARVGLGLFFDGELRGRPRRSSDRSTPGNPS